jgi:multiple sugar transport system substrate-binding protein
MARLSICLLGPFRVTIDEKPVAGFESDKVRALLAYLAVESRRPHRRETLAGLLWPDWPERSARTNLRRALSNLRSAIGDRVPSGDRTRSEDRVATHPFLHISRQTIQFSSDGDTWVDVAAFIHLVKAKAENDAKGSSQPVAGWLEEAVALYRGCFLEGFSLADSPAFDDWVLLTRERLHRQVMDALRRLAECHEQHGDYEQALFHAWRQVELDPWREKAHRQVMRLLALSGQRGAALAQYETCRQLLATQLNVEPARETTQLYEMIRSGKLQAPVSHSESTPIQPKSPAKEPTAGTTAVLPSKPKPPTRHRTISRSWAGKHLRWVGITVLALLLVIGAVILSVPGKGTAEPSVIRVWYHTMPAQALLDQKETFNAAHTEAQIRPEALEDYPDNFSEADEPPCVVELWNPLIYYHAWVGNLIPLDEYVSDELLDDFLPSAIAQGTYDGHLYGLGAVESVHSVIWGNRDYLERAGVRIPTGVEDAWTRDEFVDALERLQALDEVEHAIQFDTDPNNPWRYGCTFTPIVLSFGSDLPGPDDCRSYEGTLNGPEAVEAMTFIQGLFEQGYAGTQAPSSGREPWTEPVALWWTTDYAWMKRRAYLGNKPVLIPPPRFGERAVTTSFAQLWTLSSTCPNPDAAWEFIEFLVSPEEALRVSNMNLQMPVRRSALAQSELYSEGGPLHLFVQLFEHGVAVPWPATPLSPEANHFFGSAAQRIIIEGADAQTELDIAVEKIDWFIETNRCYQSP